MLEDRSLPDPRREPTISVARAGAILGISSTQAYVLAQRGDIPTILLGVARRMVPTAKFLAKFELDLPSSF